MIKTDSPLVIWDTVMIAKEEVEMRLAPIVKLAAQTNPSEWFQKYNNYLVAITLHTHCAVYLGGHLVKDGLSDPNVSNTLRKATKE